MVWGEGVHPDGVMGLMEDSGVDEVVGFGQTMAENLRD